eukprot:98190_1
METTLSMLFEYIQPLIEKSRNLWKSSKYFRIITIVSGSLTASLLVRNIYVTAHRKYLGLPPGELGIPFIGDLILIEKTSHLSAIMKYPARSMIMGNYNVILINNPYLAKKYYSNPRTVDLPSSFITNCGFAFINGKPWAERRRIISSNLMSTMNIYINILQATDTTYSALASSLLLAAKYPNIQQELHQEIIDAFGNNIDNIELRNGGILKIPKLRAFIHECLRIFPP